MRLSILTLVAFASFAAPALAQDRTLPAGFNDFEMSAFQMKQAEIGVATDKHTGHKVNVVKMKNGHMMVLVPFETYAVMMKGTGPDDMWN